MIQPEERITQGTLRTASGAPLPLERTDVKARLHGPVAAVEVVQRFHNDQPTAIEAVYLFPLPHEASVHTMRFRIRDRVVEANVKEKEEARRVYAAARAEGRAATLLEQDKPNLFTLSVANVPPGETIEVTLGYHERLAYDDGEWRFVFPLVTTDRYHEKAPSVVMGRLEDAVSPTRAAAPAIRPPRPATNDRAADVGIEVEIGSSRLIGQPRSPSHHVVVEPQIVGFHVRLAPSERVPNRDFVVAYRTEREGVRAAAYFERKPDAIGTFLLTITPPVAPPPDTVAAASYGGGAGEAAPLVCGNCGGSLRDAGAIRDVPGIGKAYRCEFCGTMLAASPDRKGAKVGLPRDVIFLVDRSASMRGPSLKQAARAVRLVFDELAEGDAFQLLEFDHGPFRLSDEGWLPCTAASRKHVGEHLDRLTPRGGTELEEALVTAAKVPLRPGRARILVLVTDAALGNDGRLLRRVPEILGADTRLYVLGVGPAVNRYLVERVARAGRGASDVLLPTEDVETVVPRFARRVRQAGPVLSKIKLAWDDALPADVYPSPVPDLFGGQTVQLLGRFAGSGKSRLVLTGEKATGEPFRQEIDVELPEAEDRVPGLERLWAKLRIDARLDRLAKAPAEAADVRLEVLGLALKHRLLSPYTALVAEDSEKVVEGPAKRVEMAAVAPETGPGSGEDDDGGPDELEAKKAERGGETRAGGGAGMMRAKMAVGAAPVRPSAAAAAPPKPEKAKSLDLPAGGAPPPMAPPAFRGPEGAPRAFDEYEPPAFGAPPPAPGGYAPPPPMAPAAAGRLEAGSDDDAFDMRTMTASVSAPMSPPALDGGIPLPSRAAAPVFAAAPGAAKPGGGLLSKLRDFFGGSSDEPEPPPPPPPPPHLPSSPEAVIEKALRRAPAEEPEINLTDTPAPAHAASIPGSDAYTDEQLAYARAHDLGELDLVFLVDETGSMGAYIEEVKRRLLEIIAALRAAPLCRSLRIGLVGYRDHPPQDRSFASRVVPLTDDVAAIKAGVMRMQASGGGDGPESVTDGLYNVVRLDFRPRAARVVVWVGDAPPHGVEPTGDGFPDGCPCGHHWFAQAETAREMGIVIHAVGCLPTLANYKGAVDVFKTVAGTSRGLYLPLSSAPLLIPLITGVAETELDKQRIEERIAEALAAHEAALALADEQERVRFVRDVLHQEGVQPRGITVSRVFTQPAPLRFREITEADVEEGIDRLRRAGRTQL